MPTITHYNTVMKHDGWGGVGHQEGRCGDGSEQLLEIQFGRIDRMEEYRE